MGRVKISAVIPARWRGNRDRQRAPVPECSTCEPQRNEHREIPFFCLLSLFSATDSDLIRPVGDEVGPVSMARDLSA
jgi:hypothetical protein